ncbi:hypothetical protein [Roseibium sp.]|uniref:hypothetical protein n=1 Tax=Roseibium sp. TaxID=1936156 RepID=UPI003D1251DC
MIPVSLPAPIRTEPRHFTWLALAICVLSAAFVAERAVYWSDYWKSDIQGALNTAPVHLKIGGTDFRMPLNAIATPSQRHKAMSGGSSFDMLRLTMTWHATDAGDGSLDTGSQRTPANRILIELEHNPERESVRARLEPFYRRLARGGELSGPGGLRVLTLSARKASRADRIVYDPSAQNGFIARCRKAAASADTLCHRAVVLASGLELRYRFDQALLPDWRELDRAVIRRVDGYRMR